MDIQNLRKQLEIDEGIVDEIYLDHLGFPTFGIGHLITREDPEYGNPVGTKIPKSRIYEAFDNDIEWVLDDCVKLYPDFYQLPDEAQEIIANMMFNLGYGRLSRFKGMKKGVDTRDWHKAADEMVDSKWYRQVGARSKRLVHRMRKLAVASQPKV